MAVGTAIKMTTTATPKTPRSTLAMETCSGWKRQRSETDPNKRWSVAQHNIDMWVITTNHFSSVSDAASSTSPNHNSIDPGADDSEVMRRTGFAVKYYLNPSFKGGTINIQRTKVRQFWWCSSVLRKCACQAVPQTVILHVHYVTW